MATLATALAIAVATAVATALRSQILGSYVTYLNNLNVEVQGLAGHRVVKVPLYGLLCYLLNGAEHTVTLSVAHRNLVADSEQLLSYLAINHKD